MWTQNTRLALRIFRREPAFAAAAVFTLTLGIGANVALFAVVEAVLLQPLPFEDADRLIVLRHRDAQSGLTKPDVAIGDFVDLRARQRSLESLAGYGGYQSTMYGDMEPVRVEGAIATADALRALRIEPALGRLLQDSDVREGAAPAVMVSFEFWRTHLGSDPQVLTRSFQLGATRRIVIGVLPPGFRFPGMPRTDVVVTQPVPVAAPVQRKSGWIYAFGRLQPGETLARAEAEMAALSSQFEGEFPDQNRGSQYEPLALREALVGETRRPLMLLMVAVGFVLLIACGNVGNLLLGRALGRRHEHALRLALGASRRGIVVQALAEGLVLAVAGGVAGVVVAWCSLPILAALIPSAYSVPGIEEVRISSGVLWFTFGVALVSAVASSALACVGRSGGEVSTLLGQRRSTMAPESRTIASALVAVEIALACVLLAGAGLTLRSFANLVAVDPGFTPAGVVTVQFALPADRYGDDAARRAFYSRAFAEIEALARVETVGAAMVTPLTGNNWTVPLQRVEYPLPADERPPDVGWQLASEGYFHALRIPLLAGRLFERRDATGAPVVIISEAVAARFFAGEASVGRRVRLGTTEAEIVGVVGNVRRASLTDDPRADLYFPFEQVNSPTTTLFVRAIGDPLSVLPEVRAVVRRLEPHAVLFDTRTLAQTAEESAAMTRLATRLLSGFAALALLLAAVGVYGVMSYRVRRRTRELGTRLALGASAGHVTRLVLFQATAIAATGLSIGVAAAVAFARTLSSLLFGVQPWDPLTLGSAAAALAATTLAASYLPARRAGRVDPATALAAD